MTGPIQSASYADIGAQSMANVASLDEVTAISTAQTVNGLSTLLVSEGMARLIRDIMGPGRDSPVSAPPQPAVAGDDGASQAAAQGENGAGTVASRDDLLGMSTHALGELLTRTVVSRIVDLNTVNTYLALTTAEQLRQWGRRLAGETSPAGPPARPMVPFPPGPNAFRPPMPPRGTSVAWGPPAQAQAPPGYPQGYYPGYPQGYAQSYFPGCPPGPPGYPQSYFPGYPSGPPRPSGAVGG
ncbi:MAG: hypothetical protein ACYC5Y_10920 [Symbiobacteriia bacterium]